MQLFTEDKSALMCFVFLLVGSGKLQWIHFVVEFFVRAAAIADCKI